MWDKITNIDIIINCEVNQRLRDYIVGHIRTCGKWDCDICNDVPFILMTDTLTIDEVNTYLLNR